MSVTLRNSLYSAMSLKRSADYRNLFSDKTGKATTDERPLLHGLKASMEDPDLKVEEDDLCVIIKDKYPKAKHHFLVLPKENISTLKVLQPNHLPLLKHMHEKGNALSESCGHPWSFKLGYHAIPIMSQLQLHVISTDFNSEWLKNKRYWNSFNTKYFVDSKEVMNLLESEGKIEFDKNKFGSVLKSDIKCHVCSQNFATIPSLKKHIAEHKPS